MDVEELGRIVRDLQTRVSAIESRLREPTSVVTTSGKKQSAKEFLLSKRAGSEVQKVLALAFFLERQEGVSSFNVSDLEGVFRAAREKLPKNMNDAVNKNVARGFLMEAEQKKDSKKAWQLTVTGELFVEQKMVG